MDFFNLCLNLNHPEQSFLSKETLISEQISIRSQILTWLIISVVTPIDSC